MIREDIRREIQLCCPISFRDVSVHVVALTVQRNRSAATETAGLLAMTLGIPHASVSMWLSAYRLHLSHL